MTMNEIEVQKLLVKEAFNKSKAVPDFGGIGDENGIKLRDYIWKLCGYCETEKDKKGYEKEQPQTTTSKKHALVTMYKLWSAFTKNIRYIIDAKGKSVTLARFGTFTRS